MLKKFIKNVIATYKPLQEIYKFLLPLWKISINSRLRSEYISKIKYKRYLLQQSTTTLPNRYPLLFNQCKILLEDIINPKILSYGCSTGEEVFTIGEYMPLATVVGVDVNDWCIRKCLKKNTNQKYSFYRRVSSEYEKLAEFDAIFCMAVFQSTENRKIDSEKIMTGFTFDKFQNEVTQLDGKLKKNGLLFIDNCDFNFSDTIISAHYTPLKFKENIYLRNRPLFDKENRKLSDLTKVYRAYRKLP